MAFTVGYDACALYPAPLRDLLVRVANTGLVRARWTDRILDECFENILEERKDLKPEALQRTRELMTQAVPTVWSSDMRASSRPSICRTPTTDMSWWRRFAAAHKWS